MKKVLSVLLFFLIVFSVSISIAELYTTEFGVKFGMTPQEVKDIEILNGGILKSDYTDEDSYQLYYNTDIHLGSLKCSRMEYDFDVENYQLYQVYYVSKGGEADYLYLKIFLCSRYGTPMSGSDDGGRYSLLYNEIGQLNENEITHWLLTGENYNLGIDLWVNEHNTVFAVFYNASNPVSFGIVRKKYTDETGIYFFPPEGWIRMAWFYLLNDISMAYYLEEDGILFSNQFVVRLKQLVLFQTHKQR